VGIERTHLDGEARIASILDYWWLESDWHWQADQLQGLRFSCLPGLFPQVRLFLNFTLRRQLRYLRLDSVQFLLPFLIEG
jgi:hypothetical protein